MIIENGVNLKYTKSTTTVITYDTGITDYQNIDNLYRGQSLREKVVCKFDTAYLLCRYFKPETISKYRPVLMMIAKGQITDANQFSTVIRDFIEKDEVFAKQITSIFHSCPEEQNFGHYIEQCFADVFKNVEADYRNFFRGKPPVVICVSDGYLYFSFEDVITGPVLPDQVQCEVLSYAKNWRGDFRFIEN